MKKRFMLKEVHEIKIQESVKIECEMVLHVA